MKRIIFALIVMFCSTLSLISCREQTEQEKVNEEKERVIKEMEEAGAEVKKKTDGDETKIKMETEDKEVKIKEEDGETKIKIENKNDD